MTPSEMTRFCTPVFIVKKESVDLDSGGSEQNGKEFTQLSIGLGHLVADSGDSLQVPSP
jgi:hypothetical protein